MFAFWDLAAFFFPPLHSTNQSKVWLCRRRAQKPTFFSVWRKSGVFPGVIRSRLSGNEGRLVDKCLVMITKPWLGKVCKVFSFQKQQILLRLVMCVSYMEAIVPAVCGLACWSMSQSHSGVTLEEMLELHQEPEQQRMLPITCPWAECWRCHSGDWCYSYLKASNSSLKLVTAFVKAWWAGVG